MRKILLLVFCLVLFFQIPLSLASRIYNIKAEWQYSPPAGKTLSGFRLYKDRQKVCESKVTNKNNMECQVGVTPGEITFTVTAYFSDGTETAHSAPFVMEFLNHAHIPAMLQLLLGDD